MRRSLAVVLVAGMAGCLTPAQKEALQAYTVGIAEARAAAEAGRVRLLGYEVEVTAVLAKIQAGELPVAEGTALVAKIVANRDADVQAVRDAEVAAAKLSAAIEKMRVEEVPWWGYIPWEAIIVAALSAFGVSVPLVVAKNRAVADRDLKSVELGATILGVEKAGNADVKKAIALEATHAGVGVALHGDVKAIT